MADDARGRAVFGARLGRLASGALALSLGCSASAPPPATPRPERESGGDHARAPDGRRGAAIYDRWWAALGIDFRPDNAASADVADGAGGPRGDGTLNGAGGKAMLNGGHDYRFKNLFGWDLRGADGVYGAQYLSKPHVLATDLLSVDWSRQEMADRFTRGGAGVPAFGQVLDSDQIADVVAFVFDVREGRLPRPDQIWELSPGTAGGYRLKSGANVERGRQLVGERCARCHGTDGRRFPIDDSHSLGSHTRQKAYEDWLKFIGGQPGTSMSSQLPEGQDGAAHAADILDILAALCDRTAFPAGEPSAGDAADGDVRCGAYLK
ncbi:MAG: cytochrome c [Myxococcales bacterium]|nr:cytochrome c [Myxococcales bacterium]